MLTQLRTRQDVSTMYNKFYDTLIPKYSYLLYHSIRVAAIYIILFLYLYHITAVIYLISKASNRYFLSIIDKKFLN